MLRVEDPILGGPLSDERLIPEIWCVYACALVYGGRSSPTKDCTGEWLGGRLGPSDLYGGCAHV